MLRRRHNPPLAKPLNFQARRGLGCAQSTDVLTGTLYYGSALSMLLVNGRHSLHTLHGYRQSLGGTANRLLQATA